MIDDDDDDLDPGPVPAPDDEPTAAERARARSFAELVDKVVAGRAPAAMPTEERALIEVATVIRAASGAVELSAARRASIVEEALHRAVDKSPAATSGGGGVIPLASRRASRAPWVIAAVTSAIAIAAMLALFLRPAPHATAPTVAKAPPTLPQHLRSRPADPLIGAIPRARAGDAAARIDAIFADRLDGFRELALGGP